MNYWLMKSEPDTWSWEDQVKKGAKGEMWNGVRNYQAANFMREMKKGDLAFFYHSGKKREIVGVVEIIKSAYPDPTDKTEKFVAVTVRAREALVNPVSLTTIKSKPSLKSMLLLKQSRLSVMPVTNAEWKTIQTLAKSQAHKN